MTIVWFIIELKSISMPSKISKEQDVRKRHAWLTYLASTFSSVF
jgi:hypothetical protein